MIPPQSPSVRDRVTPDASPKKEVEVSSLLTKCLEEEEEVFTEVEVSIYVLLTVFLCDPTT